MTPATAVVLSSAEAPTLDVAWRGGRIVASTQVKPIADAENEDAWLIAPIDEQRLVLAVADGCGGMRGGASASRCALDALCAALRSGDERDFGAASIIAGFDAANRAVLDLGIGAGTTLVVALIDGTTLRAFSAGDSLALVTGQRGAVRYQAVAQSPTGYGVEAGLLSDREALLHAERGTILNVVGCAAMRVEIGPPVTLRPRDTIVLASDGLTDNLLPDEIIAAARCGPIDRAHASLRDQAAARMSNEHAERIGHPDDLTIVMYRPTAS